jgi:hypothetical protein
MTKSQSETFLCPTCSASYKVACMIGAGRVEHAVHCLVCNHPFEPMRDGQIAKYFLVRRPRQKHRAADAGDVKRVGA